MASGGGGAPPSPSPPLNGGEFLLQLLQKPPQIQPQQPQPQPPTPPPTQTLPHDPAVAVVGPTFAFPPFPSNGHDLPYRSPPPPHTWTPHQSPPQFAPHNFFMNGFPQNPNPSPSWSSPLLPAPPPEFNHHNHQYNLLGDDIRKLGFLGTNSKPISAHQQEHNIVFGSFHREIRKDEGFRGKDDVSNDNLYGNLAHGGKIEGLASKERTTGLGSNRRLDGVEVEFQKSPDFNRNPPGRNHKQGSRGGGGDGGRGKQGPSGNYISPEVRKPPPGFPSKPRSAGNRESGNRSFEHNADKGKSKIGMLNHRGIDTLSLDENEREGRFLPNHSKVNGDVSAERRQSVQLDCSGQSAGSNHHSVSVVKGSLLELHHEVNEDEEESGYGMQEKMRRGGGRGQSELDDLDEELMGSLALENGSDEKNDKRQHHRSRDKDYRSDKRGQWLLSQRMRNFKRQTEYRADIHRLNGPFLAIYESLIPAEEEKTKQKQLLTSLEKLVNKEWPGARLYLYGSCANSFGFSKSDIDVCLTIEDADVNKSDILLKLADALQSDNLQNVQACTLSFCLFCYICL
ncbi:unnamed protein product [Ilex paraguariensis]|uniref:Poly(A) RNA polymerase mitochondrial-like central palm domain-containing protein n=1 Tax=Ilex paraguariensis TaxID=185542 RepID=A0ABC8UST3_9AQUA